VFIWPMLNLYIQIMPLILKRPLAFLSVILFMTVLRRSQSVLKRSGELERLGQQQKFLKLNHFDSAQGSNATDTSVKNNRRASKDD
jgi:hypothetical protein